MLASVLALLLAQPAPLPPGGPPARPAPTAPTEGPAGWREHFDELWKRRDQPGVEKELEGIVQQQLAVDSRSFDANWRLASLYNWMADGSEGDRKAELGHMAWEAGDKAIVANPEDVHGQYQAGTGIGLYSEGVGILKALTEGLE